MYQIAAAVRALGTRDWFDYLSVIAPLVLSVVAIWISIATARKQNRIALFELHFAALTDIRRILVFGAMIEGASSTNVIRLMYDGRFGTAISNASEKDALCQVMAITVDLEKSSLVKSLVRGATADQILKLIYLMQAFMLHVVHGEKYTEQRDAFCAACEQFSMGTYKELCKRVSV